MRAALLFLLLITGPAFAQESLSACAPIGAASVLYGAGQMTPVIGEDFGYLVWRKRNCCVM